MKKSDIIPDPCPSCNAACCRSVAVSWEEPVSLSDWENVKWMVSHKNVQIFKDHEGDWLIEFLTDCEHIDNDNRCRIYDHRMLICRDHPSDSCEKTGEAEYYTLMFRSAKDVDNYLADRIL